MNQRLYEYLWQGRSIIADVGREGTHTHRVSNCSSSSLEAELTANEHCLGFGSWNSPRLSIYIYILLSHTYFCTAFTSVLTISKLRLHLSFYCRLLFLTLYWEVILQHFYSIIYLFLNVLLYINIYFNLNV